MAEEKPNQKLAATSFTPLDAAAARRKITVSPVYLGLGVVAALAMLVLLYLFMARAVIFRLDPAGAEIGVDGISFNIGDNFLLLPGDHEVTAQAKGYVTLEETITVSEERTQEIELALEPLPGKLELTSELVEIEVSIDDQAVGTAPGLIEDIARGPHIIEFSKRRYFPLRQEIDIEGLGRTQTLDVVLEPAWGQMEFSSEPAGADVTIDGEVAGQTPVTTEVLETGTVVSVSALGYKTWQREVSVKAGTNEAHPLIELVVADGTLEITSSPSGANVTIDGGFRGTSPLSADLSPLRAHQVELFLEGYRRAVRSVSIEPEGRESLAVNLTPIIGRIQLSIEPADAEVIVDGRARGQGSQTLALTAKAHTIMVRKPGYAEQSFTVTPRPDHEQSLDIELLTIDQAYWATRPPSISSPVGTNLRLFRPSTVLSLGAPRREPGRRANEAIRSVRLERPFYVSTHEITNKQYRQFRGEHSSGAAQGHTLDMDNQPVVNISWQQAAIFCNWLSRREGLPLFYIEENGFVTGFNLDSHGYRLPTEAEWAWVAKINLEGKTEIFPWGTDFYPPSEVYENYADQSATGILSFTLTAYNDGFTVSGPVGEFGANPKGLYDMSGNVSEWTHDFYEIRASRGDPELDPTGPVTGDRHVIRGASWSKASRSELRLSFREAGSDGTMDTGFRIARYVDKAGVQP